MLFFDYFIFQDVLAMVEGVIVTGFVPLESFLDEQYFLLFFNRML